MRSTIWLDVEFTPGSDIADACKDAIELATKLGVTIKAPFNGVLLMAAKGDSPKDLERSWRDEMASTHSYKIATAHKGASK